MTNTTNQKQFSNISLSITLLFTSIFLAIFKVFFIEDDFVGLSNILFFFIALTPLGYLILSKKIKNRFTLWILPFLFVWMVDVFIYNNTLTQLFLPAIIVITILILHLTSMHKVDYLYQSLLPRLSVAPSMLKYFKLFFSHLFSFNPNYSIVKRVLKGLLVSLPFITIFLALFMGADKRFENQIENIAGYLAFPDIDQMIAMPLYFFLYLGLYIYSYFNQSDRILVDASQPYDKVVVGIFLGALNILFGAFLTFQIGYLFGGVDYINSMNISPAYYAREGFFQLATVISLVVIIFLWMMRRLKGELFLQLFMSAFMIQTIIMGIASLKKMQLYQMLLGMTTLRYYVEWFEYFLIAVLVLGIVLMLMRQSFHFILNTTTIMGLIAFSIVASINVDFMIASHNLEQFKDKLNQLDKNLLAELSMDAHPALQNTDIHLPFSTYGCNTIMHYHYGRCKFIQKQEQTNGNF
ncbi:DUF4153 domain-containing protein [Sulfurimonas sp.]|uniref:DUF4153 domain-containing protein n=1 Tax=Sulfurimonas sp. TaxID=2022749 RepID=UPI003D0BC745